MIHPTAIVDPTARLAEDVRVGPWTLVGPEVEIGPGTVLESHVVIKGPTVMGANNHVFQFATIGEFTPDLKYQGEPTRCVIGDNNVFREGVTVHRGTVQDRAETTVGNHNLFMAYAHVGHDSVVGNHVIMVNNASLAGHVHLGDWVILSGFTLVHQFCRIGAHAFAGMGTVIGKDVPAFITVSGTPAEARTVNTEGLRRRGYSDLTINQLRRAFRILYRQGLTLELAMQRLKTMLRETPEVQLMIDSINASERGIVR